MKLSLILAFYKNLPALALLLQALARQSYPTFEVIVAEDDQNPETVRYLETVVPYLPFPVVHLAQERDEGFRKNQMLNRAVAAATGDLMVFIDGDCVPHSRFLEAHARAARIGVASFGRRVMLSGPVTRQVLDSQNLRLLRWPVLFGTGSTRLRYGLYLPFLTSFRSTGIWGCNWSILKTHLLAVNGFDEDYVRAGIGEDIDIEWRLVQQGILLQSIRFGAIVYHLHHPAHYSDADVRANLDLFEQKKEQGALYCLRGIDQYLSASPPS
jgi:glycosyltransferase involved in cell wall biosynthesis